MKSSVYVETSVISYLAARGSRVAQVAARQESTHAWWAIARQRFQLYASGPVIDEASQGDPKYAQKRLQYLQGLPVLDGSSAAEELAAILIGDDAVPSKAADDAAHIAIAVTNGMAYLVTWNCRHIANAQRRKRIEAVCRRSGYEPTILCTPEELMGDE